MRIVLSRKGFDSQYGGVPSPILPDGRLLSLPIPYRMSPHRYSDVCINDEQVAPWVERLTNKAIHRNDRAHWDPRLSDGLFAFGQVDSAQGHLRKQGVGRGDLFLFFGWFAECGPHGTRPNGQHCLFGWLQVDEVVTGTEAIKARPELADHPHAHGSWNVNNTVYVAATALEIPGIRRRLPGAGLFTHWRPALQLTAQGESNRTVWHLPECFWPKQGSPSLSYNGNPARWKRRDDGSVRLQAVARGQEFVAPATEDHFRWLADVFRTVAG